MGEDPIGLRSRDFNFYRYVSNKPINFTDPSGKFIIFIPVLVELACGGTAITTIAVEITALEAAVISGGAVVASHLPDWLDDWLDDFIDEHYPTKKPKKCDYDNCIEHCQILLEEGDYWGYQTCLADCREKNSCGGN